MGEIGGQDMLYPHNRPVYKEAVQMLTEENQCAIIQFTGTGKTFIVMELLNTIFKDLEVLYVVPNLSICHSIMLYDEWNYPNVTFVTYESLYKYQKPYSVLILDELHRAGALTWEPTVRLAMLRARYVLGLTATPERYLDSGRDMAIELFGDNIVYGVDLEKALKQGVLPKFKYTAIMSYKARELLKLVDYVESQDIKVKLLYLDLSHYSVAERVRKYIEPYHRKGIIFCKDIQSLKSIDDDIRSWFDEPVKIFEVHSGKSRKENKLTIEEFNSCKELCVIKSVDMLTAGIHIKGVTLGVMCSSTESGNVFVQQMGRILSASDKTRIPQIIDLVGNFKNIKILQRCGKSSVKVNNDKYSTLLVRESLIAYDDFALQVEDILSSIKRVNTWTQEEDDILIKYYPQDGKEVCKRLSNKSANACSARAKKLGLTKRTKWDASEDNILVRYFLLEWKDVTKRLDGRSYESCCKRALKLGIIHEWTAKEDLILMKYWESMQYGVCQLLPIHTVSEIQVRVKVLKL